MTKHDEHTPVRVFMQACMAAAGVALFTLTAMAVETPRLTPRQTEILASLDRSRPEWANNDGVWMLGSWDAGMELRDLVDLPVGDGDAGEFFLSLEKTYPEESGALQDGVASLGVLALLQAAERATCRLTPDNYPVYDSVEAKQPDFVVYRRYLEALLARGRMMARNGDAAEAERCFRAGLVCGAHLMRDRSSSLVYATGILFQLHAAAAYESFLAGRGESFRAELAGRYRGRMESLFRAYSWKSSVALGEMDAFACLPSAIRIALEDKEAFWRKEAVLRLGRLRYGVPREDGNGSVVVLRHPSFEAMADKALSRVASRDPDPSVRRFAVWVVANLSLTLDGREQRFMPTE